MKNKANWESQMIAKYGSLEKYREKARKWGKTGGKRASAQGKSGFKTMTSEQKSIAGKLGHKAMVKKVASQ